MLYALAPLNQQRLRFSLTRPPRVTPASNFLIIDELIFVEIRAKVVYFVLASSTSLV